MSRQSDREAIESTWVVYTAADGKPLPKLDEVSDSAIIDETLLANFGGITSLVSEEWPAWRRLP